MLLVISHGHGRCRILLANFREHARRSIIIDIKRKTAILLHNNFLKS